MNGFDNCTREQQRQLLDWFFYRLAPVQRRELMADLPRAYGAYTGRGTTTFHDHGVKVEVALP